MGIAQDRMRTFMGTLDGTSATGVSALDEAVRSISNFSSAAEWADAFALELRHYALNGKSPDEFLLDISSVILNNADTGAITGSDAGNGTEKTASTVILEATEPTYPTSDTSSFHNLSVHWPGAADTAQARVICGLNSWWIPQSLQLIESSYGMNFAEAGTTVHDMTVNFVDEGQNGRLAYVSYGVNERGEANSLALNINMAYYGDISGTDFNGVSSSAGWIYLDRTIAHELVHGVMAANISYPQALPSFFTEGIAEVVHGVDDVRTSTIRTLASDEGALRIALNVNHISDGSAFDAEYAAGYLALRYLANRGGSVFSSQTSTFREIPEAHYDLGYTTLIVNPGISGEAWLDGRNGTFVPTVTNIDASTSNGMMILAGNGAENLITAGNGSASLWGGDGAACDTLSGGNGHNDFFFGSGEGSDIVRGYHPGDVVNIYKGTVEGVEVSGSNLRLCLDDGSLLLENCAERIIDVAAPNVNGLAHAFVSRTTRNIDGRSLTGFEVIAGSEYSDTIHAGNQGSSLWGGTGSASDTMYGGSDSDAFLYGDGQGIDYIQGSDAADRVVFLENTKPASVSVSEGTLTLDFSEGNSLILPNWSTSSMNTFVDSNGTASSVSRKEDGTWELVNK